MVVCCGRDGELRRFLYCTISARLLAALRGKLTYPLDSRVFGVELPARGHCCRVQIQRQAVMKKSMTSPPAKVCRSRGFAITKVHG